MYKGQIECKYCKDTGKIAYKKKGDVYFFIARCRCVAGQKQDRSILNITDIYPDYYKERVSK
jgi:hypothetical protein